jgi:hypothetical protein
MRHPDWYQATQIIIMECTRHGINVLVVTINTYISTLKHPVIKVCLSFRGGGQTTTRSQPLVILFCVTVVKNIDWTCYHSSNVQKKTSIRGFSPSFDSSFLSSVRILQKIHVRLRQMMPIAVTTSNSASHHDSGTSHCANACTCIPNGQKTQCRKIALVHIMIHTGHIRGSIMRLRNWKTPFAWHPYFYRRKSSQYP